MPTFTGFPEAALDFYDDLEMDNTKSYWEAHKAMYAESVKAPMVALTDDLEKDFGKAKVFRPYRDVRFAKDGYTVIANRKAWPWEPHRYICADPSVPATAPSPWPSRSKKYGSSVEGSGTT